MLNKTYLDTKAIAYVRERLSQGRTLATLLLDLPLEQGHMWTFVPPKTARRQVDEFSQGGIMSTAMTSPLLVDQVSGSLRRGTDQCALFEHSAARPTDPFLHQRNSKWLSYESDVLFVIESTDNDSDFILSQIRSSESHLLIGALTRTPVPLRQYQTRALPLQMLRTLAENTDGLVVGAYDGEGAIFWSRE